MRIIFMGTPGFAVASLKALVENNMNVVAVVTAPDKPVGRGQKMNTSDVKKYAESVNIPVLQPEKLKSPAFIEELKAFNADLQVVVAFRMLPEIVWSMPKKGTINLHGSLLPQYRGAAPIHWAVINGETETGVTTFFIEHEIDTGKIIFSEKLSIGENENTGSVHDKLMVIGAILVVKTVKAIEANDYPQNAQVFTDELKHAPKIFKETCKIDWNQPTNIVHNFVRGMSPFPAAWTILNDKVLKVFEAIPFEEVGLETPPIIYKNTEFSVLTDGKTYMAISTSNGFLSIKTLQLEGKKRMQVDEFLRGYRFE